VARRAVGCEKCFAVNRVTPQIGPAVTASAISVTVAISVFAGAIVSGLFSMISKLRLRWYVSQRVRRDVKEPEDESDLDEGDLVAE